MEQKTSIYEIKYDIYKTSKAKNSELLFYRCFGANVLLV